MDDKGQADINEIFARQAERETRRGNLRPWHAVALIIVGVLMVLAGIAAFLFSLVVLLIAMAMHDFDGLVLSFAGSAALVVVGWILLSRGIGNRGLGR